MELLWMDQLGLLVGIVAGLLAIFAAVIAFLKWATKRIGEVRSRKSGIEYEYCGITVYKNRWTPHGYFCVAREHEKLSAYREEPYEISTINTLLSGHLGLEPSSKVKQHRDAFRKVEAQLLEDGWEIVPASQHDAWYEEVFRRPIKQ
jgi:hypothetical protein